MILRAENEIFLSIFWLGYCKYGKWVVILHRKCEKSQSATITNGVVVQLVRIPACHAGGRGFESRPYRKERASQLICSLLLCFVGTFCRVLYRFVRRWINSFDCWSVTLFFGAAEFLWVLMIVGFDVNEYGTSRPLSLQRKQNGNGAGALATRYRPETRNSN